MKNKANIIAIIAIILFSIGISIRTLQNDTFYNIAIGEQIVSNGIDMKEHFSIHKDLIYTYPHWLFDVITYFFYNIGGFTGIYIFNIIMIAIFGIVYYKVLTKLDINKTISLIGTLLVMWLMKDFFCVRAQSLSYILFILEIYAIEKYLQNKEIKYAVMLFLIGVLIANIHAAVWWMFFILFIPYIAEYIFTCLSFKEKANRNLRKYGKKLEKSIKEKYNQKTIEKYKKKYEYYKNFANLKNNEEEKEPYKIITKRNNNIKYLVIVMIFCLLTGLLTPIKDTPYTYLIKTYLGNTTSYIAEHLPLIIMTSIEAIIMFVVLIGIITFTDVKLRLNDGLMILGLTALALYSRRQLSLLIAISSIIILKLIQSYIIKHDKKLNENIQQILNNKKIAILFVILIGIISSYNYYKNSKYDFIDKSKYPVEAVKYIKQELANSDIILYNEYDYGSYLLFNKIKVFIDSRADVYDQKFNGENMTVFNDYINIYYLKEDYEPIFTKYNISHVLIKKDSQQNMVLKKDEKYTNIYEDKYFVIYKRN